MVKETNDTVDKNPPVKVTKGEKGNLVVNQIQIASIQRGKLEIQDWRSALTNAESIYAPNATRLFDMYKDISLDLHLTGLIEKRIAAVTNKTIEYLDKKGKKVDGWDDFLSGMVFYDIKYMIMHRIFTGRKGLEFVPGADISFLEIEPKHINLKHRVITIEQNQQTGIPFDELPNVWILGKPGDLGLLLKCAPYAIWKRGNWGDWANFIEIFGIPMRVIEYDANDEQTKEELKKILEETGSAMALMIPKQASFKAQDGKSTNGDGRLQESFKDSLNAEMSIGCLGNTETTSQASHGGGNNAKAKTHQEQQNEIAKNDLFYTAAMLNDPKFQAILKSFGLPVVDGGRFVFKKDIDINFLSQRIEIDEVVSEKVPYPDDYWYDTYGVPKPENFEQAKREFDEKAKNNNPPAEDPEDPEEQPDETPKKKSGRKAPDQRATFVTANRRTLWSLLAQARDFFASAPNYRGMKR